MIFIWHARLKYGNLIKKPTSSKENKAILHSTAPFKQKHALRHKSLNFQQQAFVFGCQDILNNTAWMHYNKSGGWK